MAFGDLDVLKMTVAALTKTKDQWSLGVGAQPGVVVLAVAWRSGPNDPPNKILATDIPIPVDQIDAHIERLQRAKAAALRPRQ